MAELTYFKKFKTKNEYDAYIDGTPVLPNVSIVADEDVYFTDERPEPPHDYSKDYLTFKITSPGTINWAVRGTHVTRTVEYKLNDGEWTSITSITGASAPSISVSAGDVVQFRGDNSSYGDRSNHSTGFLDSTAGFEIEGNIMSLINGTGFTTATTLSSDYTFTYLFQNCTGLTSAENLVLPATTLEPYCYFSMFAGCTSLTTAPELPATTLVNYCYHSMFYGCESLTTAPSLPAMTLASNCYEEMFYGCESLTSAPELPATTLEYGCYGYMFYNCTSLTTAPSLPATTLAEHCYNTMFENCTSLTSAPALPATTLAYGCYGYMFQNCTSLTTAPELPATTLTNQCYSKMFYGCNSLNYIKCLATDISAYECTDYWVGSMGSGSGEGGGEVSPTGTFVKAAGMDGWSSKARGAGIPAGWNVEDA